MADYQVTEVVVYATAVLREADNRRMILDLIRVHTDLDVQIVDMPQEIYFKHFALHHRLTHPYGDGYQPIEGGCFLSILRPVPSDLPSGKTTV